MNAWICQRFFDSSYIIPQHDNMEQCISRRMLLSIVPIQINNKLKVQRKAYSTIDTGDEGRMTLEKNSEVTLNFEAADSAFRGTIILENNNDQLITKKEIIQWYDPFTHDMRDTREAISYILNGEIS